MNNLQRIVKTKLFSEESVAGGATETSTVLDTEGMGDIEIVAIPTTTAGAATSVKVEQSADGSTGWTDVTNAALATFPGGSDDGDICSIYVSRSGTGHEQYLRLSWTQSASNAATVTAFALSLPNNEAPTTAAERGNDFEAIT